MSKKQVNTASAIVLTSELEDLAVTQINAFDSDFKKAKAGISNMSNHLLVLAKRAEKDGGAEKREELYKALCRHGETVYKQSHLKDGEEQPIKLLLPFWPVAKSQVLAGLRAGLKMSDFKTVFEVQAATPKATRTPRTNDGTGAGDDGESDDAGSVSMPTGPGGEAMANAYRRLNQTLKAIVVQKPALVAAVAKSLETWLDTIDEMADLEEQAETKATAPNSNRHPAGVPREQVA